jgi:hypothetical protein
MVNQVVGVDKCDPKKEKQSSQYIKIAAVLD